MPAAKFFVDSNVLLYTRDRNLTDKVETALRWLREIVRRDIACTNLQVLNEVTNVMLRKRQDLSAASIFAEVDELSFLGTSSIDLQIVATARTIRLKTSFSWWDCLLLASAVDLGCTHFLSEDLQNGQTIQGLTIVDPFAHSPEQILLSR
ncbi:Predicted nucleic acid-binding protein, contains PIN domain [Mesorhizobium albiziae]|uniref:Predicted nucleic acid-binding protein, contains PIN domain n=1 Tax=Neomesorhizobium albiziae TaxID=335020 RepID=A0A1I3ZB42_9HYPH|nr:PIN domain-containing protein [Mesorhizobium albiziae]GLS32115.1 twitching motility protein PilT [Mesorhizobium albiziae]SFK41090.1 Predicted nucleic acid-binding protein, contains PIN domain [Mesorhizobium albiziae]